jgi:hypothetical protein
MFEVVEKFSGGALSQHSSLRLIDQAMPYSLGSL